MIFEQKTILQFYRRLIALYPAEFRERFGESIEQTFNDLCNERLNHAKTLSLDFVGWLFIETFFGIVKENLLHLKKIITMENILGKQKKSAIIGLTMALPLMLTVAIVLFGIEPLNHYLRTITTVGTENDFHLNAFGKVFFITAILLLPIGFVVSLTPLIKGVRNDKLMLINPFNLFVTTMLLIFTARLLIGFMSEQYSCWNGICD